MTDSTERTKNIFLNLIKKEYAVFRYTMLTNCPKSIYDSCVIIRFYECIHEYFLYNTSIDVRIIDAFSGNEDIINTLYHFYLKHEDLDVGTWEDIDELLLMYICLSE